MDHPHERHRQRVKKRFREQGLKNFEPHNVLELLLFYAIPRRDTNEIAHRLLETFGTFSRVLDAPVEELVKVEGISENSAVLLKLIPQICQLYYEEKVQNRAEHTGSLVDYLGKKLVAKYIGEVHEISYLICLDNRLRVLYFGAISEGTGDSVSILTRRIVEIAIRCNATSVILAHNHPSGLALPSRKDKQTTIQLYNALQGVSIRLLDHIIVAQGEYISMAGGGMLSPTVLESFRSSAAFADGDYDPEELDALLDRLEEESRQTTLQEEIQ